MALPTSWQAFALARGPSRMKRNLQVRTAHLRSSPLLTAGDETLVLRRQWPGGLAGLLPP